MSGDSLPYALRAASAQDLPFVIDSWVMSYRAQGERDTGSNKYVHAHKAVVRGVLKRGATVLVACDIADPETIIGWACTEGPRLVHYVYVKQDFRRLGIARRLLEPYLSGATVHSHDQPRIPTPKDWVYCAQALMLPELAGPSGSV